MNVGSQDREVFNPFSVSTCLHCGDPIQQPKHGGRPRRYCDKPACRKAGSRAAQKAAQERWKTENTKMLRQRWKQFDETTQLVLQDILQLDGIEAAAKATKAIEYELAARQQLANARNLVDKAELVNQVRELEQRLEVIKDIEKQVRLDTEARHFKAWLKRQGHYPPGSLSRRLIDDKRLPSYASRSFYEAKLRACEYSDEDIQQFQELWKALLIAHL